MRRRLFLGLSLAVMSLAMPPSRPALAAASQTPASLELRLPSGTKRLPVLEASSALKLQRLTVQDPVYETTKTYEGYRLEDVLRLGGWHPGEGDAVVFHCQDGYAPAVPIEQLAQGQAMVAVREAGVAGRWVPFTKFHPGVTPAPYYMVWKPHQPQLKDTWPWPHQVVALEVVSFRQKYPGLYPEGAPKGGLVMTGFAEYRATCMPCHSLNGEGGHVGPELNRPANVTEYWNEAYLRRFVRNSESVRAGAKMPPLPQLSDGQLDAIVAYLKHMKHHKQPVAGQGHQ